MYLNRTYTIATLLIAGAVLAGCQHGSAPPLTHETPAPAPELRESLDDLRENFARIHSLKLNGRAAFSGPGFEGTPVLEGRVFYQKPGGFYLEGRKVTSLMVWMAANGEESVLVLHHKKRYYHNAPDGSGRAAPSAAVILREVLFAGDWADASDDAFTLSAYNGDAGTAELEYVSPGYRRVLQLQGRPWVVTESRLYDATGALVAQCTREEFRVADGVRLPRRIDAEFPEDGIGIRLILRSMGVNEEVDDSLFDIAAHLEDLESELFVEGAFREDELREAAP